MSNQKNKLLLDFLSDYTSGKIDFNYNEIKAGMRFYEMSIGHNLSEETFDEESNEESITPSEPSYEMFNSHGLLELPSEDSADDDFADSTDSNQDRTPIVENKIDSRVWSQNFCKQVKDYLYPELISKRSYTQENIFKYFDKKFYKSVPAGDKIKTNNSRPKYHDKIHKLIYNNWIISNEMQFTNGIYTVVKKNQA